MDGGITRVGTRCVCYGNCPSVCDAQSSSDRYDPTMVRRQARQLDVGQAVVWQGEDMVVLETTHRHQRVRLALLDSKLNIVSVTLAQTSTVNLKP